MTTALVVGANGGIGAATARLLSSAGHRLLLVARSRGPLEQLAQELRARDADVLPAAFDASEDGVLTSFLTTYAPEGIHVAVNNLGVSHRPTPFDEIAEGDLDRVVTTDLLGVARCLRAELAAMRRGGGAIVNVASTAGLGGAPGMGAYAAAKHGVVGLTRTVALDEAAQGIRVNAVCPGPIESGPIMDQPAAVRDQVGQHIPMRRMGRAEEVAAAIVWLASPSASYVTGVALPVDGGKTAA